VRHSPPLERTDGSIIRKGRRAARRPLNGHYVMRQGVQLNVSSNIAYPLDGPARTSPGPGAAALIGGAVSGGAVAAFSGDWACAALGAAVVAGAVCGLAAYILGRRAGRRRKRVAAALAVLVVVRRGAGDR